MAPGPARRGSPKVRTRCSVCADFVCTACSDAAVALTSDPRHRARFRSRARYCDACVLDGYGPRVRRAVAVAGTLTVMVLTLAGCGGGPALVAAVLR